MHFSSFFLSEVRSKCCIKALYELTENDFNFLFLLETSQSVYLRLLLINCIGKEKSKHCATEPPQNGLAALPRQVHETLTNQRSLYRLMAQARPIKHLAVCRHALDSSVQCEIIVIV